MTDRPALLTLGHGYSAAALAASLLGSWKVSGTARTRAQADVMRACEVAPVDWADATAVVAALRAADHLLVSVPPEAAGDPALRRFGGVLAEIAPRWIGYLSTTGVYGDRQGGWVNEESALRPMSDRGAWRVAAERRWRAVLPGANVFRLAGIYGPGRSAFERLRAGRARRIIKPGQVFSRIHVEDIAASLAASMGQPSTGRAYNLADDLPAPPQDVIAFAARLLGLQVPPDEAFEMAEMSDMARSFYGESKRVSNRRMRDELGVDLKYSDYRIGLRAILAAES